MSLVNGFNFGFTLAPTQNAICAVSHEESGPNHYDIWGPQRLHQVLAAFPEHISRSQGGKQLMSFCPAAQVVKSGPNEVGCQSDLTYASNNPSTPNAAKLACMSPYNSVNSCPPARSDPPPYGFTKPPPAPISRPFSDALAIGKGILLQSYTWSYEDFRGTFTCDGNVANYTVTILDLSTRAPGEPEAH